MRPKPTKKQLLNYYKRLCKRTKSSNNHIVQIITMTEKERIKNRLVDMGFSEDKLTKYDI